jgi:hypothetical protein
MKNIVEIPVEYISAKEMRRLRAIEAAAVKAVQSLRDDGWTEDDDQAVKEEWLDLMRLIPDAH